MVSLSAEQWRSIVAEKVLSLLGEEGAVTKPEMEAKLSEAPPQPGLRRPEPHHLTMARNRLAGGRRDRVPAQHHPRWAGGVDVFAGRDNEAG